MRFFRVLSSPLILKKWWVLFVKGDHIWNFVFLKWSFEVHQEKNLSPLCSRCFCQLDTSLPPRRPCLPLWPVPKEKDSIRFTVWVGWMLHWKWNNRPHGPHKPVRPTRPLFPFPVWQPPYPQARYFSCGSTKHLWNVCRVVLTNEANISWWRSKVSPIDRLYRTLFLLLGFEGFALLNKSLGTRMHSWIMDIFGLQYFQDK